MTEWVEQGMCIKFCIKLEHSSAETIGMIQKATAMGNWWLAASSWQCARSCITSQANFFSKTQNYPDKSALLKPRFLVFCCDFWLIPKLKSPLKRKRFQTIDEIQENTTGQLMAIGRTVWGPKVPTVKGTEEYIVLCTMFLLSCYLLQLMTLFFILLGWIPCIYQGLKWEKNEL